MTETPIRKIDIDPNVAMRELWYAWHDYTCDNTDDSGQRLGPRCPERNQLPDQYDRVMSGLIGVANVAQQLALLHLTVRYDLSPEQALEAGIYPSIDWPSLLPLLGCAETQTLDNGDVVECVEQGVHPTHRAEYQGVSITWEVVPDPHDPDTPEEAAQVIAD